MNKIILFLLTMLAATCYADDGSTNKDYQACFKACAPDVKCNGTDGSGKTMSFNTRVACSNKQLNCEFACKDKYNIE